jgi:threonine/homoserine/homoserine lactone efflux protein
VSGAEGAQVILDQRFLAFLLVFALLIVTPGPDTAMVIRSALAGGRRASSFTALGIGIATIAWVAAALLGVAVIIQRSPLAFAVLRLAGGGYLAYLGARSLTSALRDARGVVEPSDERAGLDDRSAFTQGLMSNLLNAKTGWFFLTVLPQFVEPTDPAQRWVLMLLAYELMLLVWLNLYGYVVSRAARTFMGTAFRRTLQGITGLVLIGLGARLLLEQR